MIVADTENKFLNYFENRRFCPDTISHFVPVQKKISNHQNWFLCQHKVFWRNTKCTKHFRTCRRTSHKTEQCMFTGSNNQFRNYDSWILMQPIRLFLTKIVVSELVVGKLWARNFFWDCVGLLFVLHKCQSRNWSYHIAYPNPVRDMYFFQIPNLRILFR